MKLLQSVFVLLLISENLSADSKYCVQVTAAYDFDRNDMKPAVERILKSFDYARIDKRGNQLVLRVGNYDKYSDGFRDLRIIQETYRDAYIRKCDYIPQEVFFEIGRNAPAQAKAPQSRILLKADPRDEYEFKVANGLIPPQKREEPKRDIEENIRPENEIFVLEEESETQVPPQQEPKEHQKNISQEKAIPRERFEYTKREKYNYALWNECQKCFAPIELESDFKQIKEEANRKEALKKRQEAEAASRALYEKETPSRDKTQEQESSFFTLFSTKAQKKQEEHFFKDSNQRVINQETPLANTQIIPKPSLQSEVASRTPEIRPNIPEANEESFETIPNEDMDDFFNLEQEKKPQESVGTAPVAKAIIDEPIETFFDIPQQSVEEHPEPPRVITQTVPREVVVPRQIVAQPVAIVAPAIESPIQEEPLEQSQSSSFLQEQSDTYREEKPLEIPTKRKITLPKEPKREKSFFSFFKGEENTTEEEQLLVEDTKEQDSSSATALYEDTPQNTQNSDNKGIYDLFDIDDTKQQNAPQIQEENFEEKVASLEPEYPLSETKVQIKEKEKETSYQEPQEPQKPQVSKVQSPSELEQLVLDSYKNVRKTPTQPPKEERKKEQKKREVEYSRDGFAKPIEETPSTKKDEVPQKESSLIDMYESLDDGYTQVSYGNKYSEEPQKEERREKREEMPKESLKNENLLDEYEDLSGQNNLSPLNEKNEKNDKYDLLSEYEE